MSYCKNHKSYSCGCSCTNCSCLFPSNSECLKYKGSYLECLDIANGDVLTDIIVKINDAICEGIVPASGNIYILESCDSNITVSSETSGNTTTYTICLSDTITDQLTENTTNIASLQTCCDESIKELISSDGSIYVSNEGSGTWDITIQPPSGNTYWSTTGNGGLNSSTNFIGTTDSVDLVFKVNNTEAGRINTTNTSFGYNSINSVTSGTLNCSFGRSSLFDLTSGSNNTGVGQSSLSNITTSNDNVGIGAGVGNTLITGSSNTLIGSGADVSSSASQGRIALGFNSTATADYQFAIPDDVTTIKFKGITYTLPTSLPVTTGVLTCDSSGNLTWA